MSQKRLARAFGAGTLAMATVVSGLSFGPAAAMAAPEQERSATNSDPSGSLIFRTNRIEGIYGGTYGFELGGLGTITNGDRVAATPGVSNRPVTYLPTGQLRFDGTNNCLGVGTIGSPGVVVYNAVRPEACNADGSGQRWTFENGGLRFGDGRYVSKAVAWSTGVGNVSYLTRAMTVSNESPLPLHNADGAITPPAPAENGGIRSQGVGFSTSVNVGETNDLYFGLESTGNLNSLNPATYELRAPAGTKFVNGATKSEYREGTEWRSDPNSPATLTVLDDGARATVTITTRNDWGRPSGKQSRWAVPIQGTAAGNGNVSFTGTGTSNLGQFTTSGQSAVTVVGAAVGNGGVSPNGLGFPTSIQQGATAEIPFGLHADNDYGNLKGSVTLTAPTGTTFPDQASVPGQWRPANGSWSGNDDGLALSNIRISGDRRTLTADFDPSYFGGQSKDAELRWVPKLSASSTATVGTRDMGFTFTGTTNRGSFTSSGDSAVTVTAVDSGVTNGGLYPVGPSFAETLDVGETKDVFFGLRARDAISSVNGTTYEVEAPAGTRFVQGASKAQILQGSNWVDTSASSASISIRDGGARATVTVSTNSGWRLDAQGRARWSIPLEGVTAGSGSFRFEAGGSTNLGPFGLAGYATVTVNEAAAPITNGGVQSDTSAWPLSLKVGETKDLFFGLKASAALTSGTSATWTVNVPAGTKLSDGPVKAQKRNADGTWSDDANSTASVTLGTNGSTATVTIATSAGWSLPAAGEYRWGLPLTGTAAGSGDAAYVARGETNQGQFFAGNTSSVEVTDVAPLVANVDSVDDTARSAQLSGTAEPGAQVKYGSTEIATAGADGRWSGAVTGLELGAQTLTLDQFVGSVKAGSTTVEVTVAAPISNGGVDQATIMEPLSLKVGEKKDLYFGLTATAALSDLSRSTWIVDVPAGAKFSDGPVKAQKRNADGTWSDDTNSTATVEVGPDGRGARVTVTTSAGWSLPAGGAYRWSLPLTGTAAGSGEALSYFVGQTNLGSVYSGNTARIDVQDVAALTARVDSVDSAARSAQLSGTAEPGAQVKYGTTAIATAGADGRWNGTVSGLAEGMQTLTLDQFIGDVEVGSTTVDVTVIANGGLDADGIGFPLSLEPGASGTASFGFESTVALDKIEDGSFTLNAPAGTTFPANATAVSQYLAGTDWAADPNVLLSVVVAPDGRSATVSVATRPNWQMADGQKNRINIPLQADANAASGTRDLDFTGVGTTNTGDFRVTGASPVTITEGVAAPTAQVTFAADISQKATVSGTGADGARITIKNGSAVVGTATVRNGTWSIQIDPIGAGATTLTVEQTGVGAPQSVQTVADFGAAVAISGPSGSIVPGYNTITGTTQAGAKVTVSAGDKTVEATVTGTTWTAELEIAPSATPVTVTAKQQSKGNLRTEANAQVTTDGAQQSAEVVITEPGDGTYRPGVSTILAGTATPYARVVVTNQWGGRVGAADADVNGRWSFTRQYGPSAMYKLVATQTRVNGTTSTSAEFTLAPVGAFRPLQLTTPALTSTYIPGRNVLFTGTATPGATITATSSWGSTLFSTRASQTDGTWAAQRGFGPSATYVATITQTAPDGTTDRINPVILTPPAHQDVVLTTPSAGATYVPGAKVVFSGTATPGAKVAVKSKLSGYTLFTADVDENGRWSYERAFGPTATYNLDIVATDADGTISSTELLNFAPAAN